MRFLRVVAHRLHSLFRGGRLDREAREELQQHFDRHVAMHAARGLSPSEARRAARLEFGTIDQLTEASRDARGLMWFDALRSDLRHAVGQVRRRPGFASAAMLTIAIGVGATAAVFSVVDAALLRPLPFPSADRLYVVYEYNSWRNVGRTRATALNYLDWREQSKSFSGMAAHVGTGFTLTGRGDPEFALGQLVTSNLLDVLQVTPAMGRTFLPHEMEAGHHRVVILTHALWMTRFGGDSSIVNSTTTINGEPYEVIGVLPPGFSYPTDEYKLLAPLVTGGELPGGPPINRSARYLRVIARLGDNATETAAKSELDVIGKRLAAAYPDSNATVTIGVSSLRQDTVGEAGAGLVVVLIAAGFVLLIACVNVAGLSIARGHARARELAVRTAIGAGRGRLVQQLAIESLVLFVLGGAAGLALSAWMVSAFASSLPAAIPRVHDIAIDLRFILSGAALTLGAGLIFSVLPALQIARRGPAQDLSGARGVVSATPSTQRTRGILIVGQVAAAIVLLVGASLALRSLSQVNAADKGFDTANTMTFSFALREQRYPTADQMRAFVARTNDALQAAAGVVAAGTTTHLPLADNNLENSFTVDGVAVPDERDPPMAAVRGIAGRYLDAIGAHLLQGRDLGPGDTATSEPVAIVTEDFARRYITPRHPIGARVKMGGADSDDPWRTVVGVVAPIRHAGLDQEPRPEVWMPFAQLPDSLITTWLRGVNVAARTSVEPETTMPALRDVMRRLDADIPLVGVQSMEALAGHSTADRRLETSLLSAFATIAVLLAAIGLFGVLAFYVAQHTQEFGLRLALGATPGALLSLVMRRGILLLAIGLAIGIPGALMIGRGMSTILYGVAPADPLALAAAVLVLTAVAGLACALPARRAMKTDPLTALRAD